MKVNVAVALVTLILLLNAESVQAQSTYDGVLSLSPVGEHSCLAVAIPVTPGQPIGGISWLHNDSGTAFPRLLIVEGEVGSPPDLSQSSLVLEEITGESLGHGHVTFDTPVTSSTGVVFAVFQLPAFTEKVSDGLGGGPGIGYVRQRGAGAAYASGDGVVWTRLHPDFSMRVELQPALGKLAARARPLSDLRASCPAGWWDELAGGQDPGSDMSMRDEPAVVSARRPLAVVPNPFNPRTTVQFYLDAPGKVNVDVYDLRGRRVRSLLRETFSAGAHEVVWQGVDDRGASVASGVYFVRLQTPAGAHLERTALVR